MAAERPVNLRLESKSNGVDNEMSYCGGDDQPPDGISDEGSLNIEIEVKSAN